MHVLSAAIGLMSDAMTVLLLGDYNIIIECVFRHPELCPLWLWLLFSVCFASYVLCFFLLC